MLSSLESRHPFFSGQELAAKGLMVSAERLSAVEFLLPQPWGLFSKGLQENKARTLRGKPKGSNTEVSFASMARSTVYSFTFSGELLFGCDSSTLDHAAESSGLTTGEMVVATVAGQCLLLPGKRRGPASPCAQPQLVVAGR